ncbi:MAG: Gfo/Idh/MocA family oxidoreductase [Firmicutes bacterium]|nr:Gfo/Idh/MocA family oxidoreductase [Bacillota bacterium]
MKDIRMAMIGYKFMGKAHSHAYHDMSMFFPHLPTPIKQVICGRTTGELEEARRRYGWQEAQTDWQEVVARADIDAIDISVPSNVHRDIALAAAAQGKHIFCEKPLALTLEDSKAMWQAAQTAGIVHMVGFNYRFAPAVRLAKSIIESGRLGRIYHMRAVFLQDWIVDPQFPHVWRLDKSVAGSGSLGDLGAHTIDLARYLVGEFKEVIGVEETFVKQRPMSESMTGLSAKAGSDAPMKEVTVDDATIFLARFQGGALGSFEATRFALGHRSTHAFEINGSKGSVRFDFERLNELEVYFESDDDDVRGFRRVLATDPAHAYSDVWWPAGHTIGYEHTVVHAVAEFLEAIRDGRQAVPDFGDGVMCQAVLEAVERSCDTRSWVHVEDELAAPARL